MGDLNLFTNGVVKTKDGKREFSRLLGGFGDNKPTITDKQIAELLNYKKGARAVRQRISENIKHFDENIHIIDLKSSVPEQDTSRKVLKTLGYTEQAINLAKNIYVLSYAGFLLYLKFAEGDKSVELYKDFIEDYFQTKAENMVMDKTLKETLDLLVEERTFIVGKMFLETDEEKKMEYFNRNEVLCQKILEVEKTLAKEDLFEKVKDQIVIADRITSSKNLCDMNKLAKLLDIKGMGRNKLFEYLRNKQILMANNQPYQAYSDYFKTIAVVNPKSGHIHDKTLVKSKGISYIVKHLIRDRKIESQTYQEIMGHINDNLEKIAA
ncbi:phage antirepressor KilAC domain-containing protein [Clostridium sp. UBA2485]|uniref:phage antirepressor KilAC domain-containing protein n=1 Tax=Clostridium sp. UBA2485 TaxID=1946352 RepID=UPI0025B7B3FF|nr:phage antirepressor KilAC domain-containing protein [Clostridium sp. UBA2485]